MLILALTGLLLQASQTIAPTESWPVKGVTRQVAQHLQNEIEKAEHDDDLARLILYWSKVTSATISDTELNQLRVIANRRASRQFGPDKDLYTTMFAGQILNLYENAQEDQRKRNEQKIANERAMLELQKQIEELKRQIADQKKDLDEIRAQKKKLQ